LIRLLLDENLSPETATFLRSAYDADVSPLVSRPEAGADDDVVAELARKEKRVVVTFDLDFGEMCHFGAKGALGVIVLRLRDQTVESVNRVLGLFFDQPPDDIDLEHSLVVLRENSVRIVRPE
jgi:predicted nuclease of predicted toxin-antitoxin system